MRIIRINIKKFGKLSDFSLDFDKGITVISGNNEVGKSTVGAFIRYMLYGVGGRNTDILTNDKLKYAPWDGQSLSGNMTVECDDGKKYTIIRSGASSGNVQILDANGDRIDFADSPGEFLLAVDVSSFSKSAYVGQADIYADKFNGLSQTVRKLLFSTYGEASAEDVRKRLVSEKNLLKNEMRKTGRIFELNEQISKLEADTEKFRNMHKELLNAEFSLSETKKAFEKNEEIKREIAIALENLKCIKAKEDLEKLREIVKRISTEKENYDKACEASSYDGFLPDRDYVEQSDAAYYAVLSCKDSAENARFSLLNAQNEYNACAVGNEKCKMLHEKLVYRNEILNETRAANILESAEKLASKAEKMNGYAKLFLCLVITFPLFFVFRAKENQAWGELSSLCSIYGCKDRAELTALLLTYPGFKKMCESLQIKIRACEKEVARTSKSFENACRRINEVAAKMGQTIDAKSDSFKIEYKTFRSGVVQRIAYVEKARKLYETALEERRAFLSVNDIDRLERDSRHITNPEPDKDYETLKREFEYAERANELLTVKIAELERQAGIITGSVPNPTALASELGFAKKELEKENSKHEAITLAIDMLDKTCVSVWDSAIPELSEKASKIFNSVTDGKYTALHIGADDSDIKICPQELDADNPESFKSIDYLSAGTLDAACVSIRLAFAECFCKEKPPVVFDDTFAKLDDSRLQKMMEVLYRLSKDYQIIILTCHKREQVFLDNRAKAVNMPVMSE